MKPRTLHALLSERAEREPERLAYRFVDFEKKRESEISYAALDRRARAIARMLSGRDVSDEARSAAGRLIAGETS